jgi:hypothetical protein
MFKMPKNPGFWKLKKFDEEFLLEENAQCWNVINAINPMVKRMNKGI